MYHFICNARSLIIYGVAHFFMYSEPALLIAIAGSLALSKINREVGYSSWEVAGRSLPAPLLMAVAETLL